MPLDSSDALVGATGGKVCSGQNKNCAEGKVYIPSSWCYLNVHHGQLKEVNKTLSQSFTTYIHTNIVYHRERKGVNSEERPTIPGLLFVQGEAKAVQNYINEHFSGVFLAKDCATGQVAVIRDSVMQSFMTMAQIAPTRIRFLHHILKYYAEGNELVRITSGVLAGIEGFYVRFNRDRCLVTSLGGITISIGGINRENLENVDPI